MIWARFLGYINTYALWLYGAGLLLVLLGLREVSLAQREHQQTIFSLEKEFASSRLARGRAILLLALAFIAVVAVLQFVVIPNQSVPVTPAATPTHAGIQLPTLIPSPTPTRTLIPTRPRPTSAPVTPTALPIVTAAPAAPCPQPGVCITSPARDQVVRGQVTVRGTADIPSLQFYKVEYGIGEEPKQWNSIGDIKRARVSGDTLALWDTAGFPSGTYLLRLTVVDASGNFPTPFAVRVVVQQ